MEAKGLQEKVKDITASMDELPFSHNEFALFWAQPAYAIAYAGCSFI